MAYDVITFENPDSGLIKKAPAGFSWTTFFFGFFVPLFRGDWKFVAIMLVLSMITFGLSQWIFAFLYNKWYIEKLASNGFKVNEIKKGDIGELSKKLGIKLAMIGA
jgi:uncharacterized membrane protein YjjP (DUF1212 family)